MSKLGQAILEGQEFANYSNAIGEAEFLREAGQRFGKDTIQLQAAYDQYVTLMEDSSYNEEEY